MSLVLTLEKLAASQGAELNIEKTAVRLPEVLMNLFHKATAPAGKQVSRRAFLKRMGAAGAAGPTGEHLARKARGAVRTAGAAAALAPVQMSRRNLLRGTLIAGVTRTPPKALRRKGIKGAITSAGSSAAGKGRSSLAKNISFARGVSDVIGGKSTRSNAKKTLATALIRYPKAFAGMSPGYLLSKVSSLTVPER